LINFAHGDIYMVGTYLAYYTSMQWVNRSSVHPYLLLALMLVISMVGCATLGLLIERFADRPLRQAPRISVLITAIGVCLFLEYAARFVFRTSPPPNIVQAVNVFAYTITILGIQVSVSQLMILG